MPGEPESAIDAALRQFGATEANLVKLVRIFDKLRELTPDGIAFGSDPQYDDLCRDYEDILNALPKIDGWKPEAQPIDLNALAQWKLDAAEIGEITATISADEAVEEPGRELRLYRHRLNKKRRQLVRDELIDIIADVDRLLRDIDANLGEDTEVHANVKDDKWRLLEDKVQVIDALLGSSLPRPNRWTDLHRHLHFGQLGDLRDIIQFDWPDVKNGLMSNLYQENEPIPVETEDLGVLTATKPRGAVSTKLKWRVLDAEDFERLLFALIGDAKGYENPEWLIHTNAPDRGRDLSVTRVRSDALGGVSRQRVIIQCRHTEDKSVNTNNIATLKEQIKLWEPPRVDVLVIATTGRFTEQAVATVEKNNNDDRALSIEMWPESHLERLLSTRPALIAQFNLK